MEAKRMSRVLLLPAIMLWTLPSHAANEDDSPAQGPVCMAMPANTPSGAFMAMVPTGQQQAMADRGYTPTPCPDDPAAIVRYREKTCQFAATVDEATRDQMAQTYHVTPQELCDYANALGQ